MFLFFCLFQAWDLQMWKHLWFSLPNHFYRDLSPPTWQYIFMVEPTTFWKWVWYHFIFYSLKHNNCLTGLCCIHAFFPTKVDLHIENADMLLKSYFGHQTHKSDEESVAHSQKHVQSKDARRTRRKTDDGHRGDKEMCLSSTSSYLDQARAMVRTVISTGRVSWGNSQGRGFNM